MERKSLRALLKMALWAALLAVPLAASVGCHSAFVDATVLNRTGADVTLLEVDYPSASFGTSLLPTGGTFHYRFKILGDGPAKVDWTGPDRQEHHAVGPVLREGQEGALTVTLRGTAATWQTQLTPK